MQEAAEGSAGMLRRRWRERQRQRYSPALAAALAALGDEAGDCWLVRLRRPPAPVTAVIRSWLGEVAAGWVVAPAAGWDYAAGGDREFLAYPEALEADPLALLGLAFVWAGTDAARWCRLIPRLGPLVGPAVLAGAPAAQAGAVLAAWAGRYPQAEVPPGVRQAWAAAGGGEVFAACAWPAWPDTGAERAMLEAGLVPHGADGQPPPDPLPVLAASAGLAPAQRVETLGLVAKALESWELGRRWAAARAAEEAGRHGIE